MDPEVLGALLADYFESLSTTWAYMWAKRRRRRPRLSTSCPRSRALEGFRRLVPAGSRHPMPLSVLLAIFGWMMHFGHAEMGLAMLVMFFLYLRPHELR